MGPIDGHPSDEVQPLLDPSQRGEAAKESPGVDALKSGELSSPPSTDEAIDSSTKMSDITLATGAALELFGLSSVALGIPLCVANPAVGGVFIGIGAVLMIAGAVLLTSGIKSLIGKEITPEEAKKGGGVSFGVEKKEEQKPLGLEDDHIENQRDPGFPSAPTHQPTMRRPLGEGEAELIRPEILPSAPTHSPFGESPLSENSAELLRNVKTQAVSVTARVIESR